jgi:predicted membrane protein
MAAFFISSSYSLRVFSQAYEQQSIAFVRSGASGIHVGIGAEERQTQLRLLFAPYLWINAGKL